MVHLFTQKNYRIALDTESGAVHVLSDIAYDMLSRLSPPLDDTMPARLAQDMAAFGTDELSETYAELYSLYTDGLLFSEPVIKHAVPYDPERGVVKSMCLHISHDCNMRCRYCFAGAGGYTRKRSLMSYECGCAAIDFLLRSSLTIRNLEVDFFGGEPLMNFDTVKRLVAYGRQEEKKHGKNIRFTITTNGTLLDDEAIEFINENMSNAVLSVDGRREINDFMRPCADGSGSYDAIIPAYKKLTASRTADWYVRGTYTRRNLDFCEDVLYLADEGFKNISVEPVVLPEGHEYSIRGQDLPAVFAEYEKLTDIMLKRQKQGRAFTFFHFMIDLDAGPCVYKRTKGCGCGTEYVAVTPEGDIYPCHQFVEHSELKLGNIYDVNYNHRMAEKFSHCNITENEKCVGCWARYFCGGGCPANNYNFTSSIFSPYEIGCELEKKRVECAITIKVAQSMDEE